MSGRLKRWFGGRRTTTTAALCCCLLLAQAGGVRADEDSLVVTYTTPSGSPTINQIHSWVLHVETADGVPVEQAKITVTGGMPEHDHGMPTKPRIVDELGGGDYVLDGMRFHMSGYWEIELTITTEQASTVVVIPLQL